MISDSPTKESSSSIPIDRETLTLSKSEPINETQLSPVTTDYKVVGYFSNMAQYRTPPGNFVPEQINAKLFTHIIYAYAKVEDVTFKVIPNDVNDVMETGNNGMYSRFHRTVRKQNPTIKTIIG